MPRPGGSYLSAPASASASCEPVDCESGSTFADEESRQEYAAFRGWRNKSSPYARLTDPRFSRFSRPRGFELYT